METIPSALIAWESFYVIVGSSAAALTGLQFVVITLIADSRLRHSQREIDVFGTPIVMHFSVVFLIAAVLSAPWHAVSSPAVWIGLVGLAGLLHAAMTHRRMRETRKLPEAYQPTTDDEVWYRALPALAYLGLLAAGIALYQRHTHALYVIAGVVLFLLLVSIRNAWDTVTFVAEQRGQDS
jgi:hypothetical protein